MEERTPEPTDAELVQRARAGEVRAFEALIERYYAVVRVIAWSRVPHREDAEEIAQEVLLRVYLRLGDLKRPEAFAPWLRQIARAFAANHATKERRRSFLAPTIPIDEEALGVAHEPIRESIESMDRAALARQLDEVLKELPARDREIVLLHFQEGWTRQAIAGVLGVDATTVGRRLDRALEKMRGELAPKTPPSERARLPKQSPAQARAFAVVLAAAALPEAARATLAAAAKLPATGAMSGSKFTASLSWWGTLTSASESIATGAAVMGKGKAIAATVVAIGLVGGGAAVVASKNRHDPLAEIPPPNSPVMAMPSPVGNNWLVGSWMGTAEIKDNGVVVKRRRIVYQVSETAPGRLEGVIYSPDAAVGIHKTDGLKVEPNGTFDGPVAVLGGGISGKRTSADTLDVTLNEFGHSIPGTVMTRTSSPPPLLLPATRNAIPLPEAALPPLAGVYARSASDTATVQFSNGRLVGKIRGFDPTPLHAESPTKFFSKDIDVQFEFVIEQGRASAVVVTTGFDTPPETQRYQRVR